MAGNRPARERFEFSLDAGQVAGVTLGSLGALVLAFFLGHALGQRVVVTPVPAPRAAPAASTAPADPLAALDHAPRPDGGESNAALSFHETLTSARPPPDRLPPAAASSPAAPAPVASAVPAAASAAGSAGASGTPGPASRGAWVVQVGSNPDRLEADRIAARFASRGARVTAAEVPGKGRRYRVRIGFFETREAADRYMKELERSTGGKGFYVAPAT